MNRSSLRLGALLFVVSVSACGSSGSSSDDEHASSSNDDTGSTEGGEGGDLGDEICPDHLGTPVEMSGFVADDEYFYTMADQAIHRTPVAGGDPEEVVQVPGSSFSGFVLGDEHMFFVAEEQAWRVDKAGGEAESLGEVPHQVSQLASAGESVAVVSVTNEAIEVWLATTPGGPAVMLASMTTEGIAAIASDEDHVYWVGFDGGNLRRVPLTGGEVELVADSTTEMVANIYGHGIALTSDEVLWSASYQSFDDGRLFAIPKQGGERRVLTGHGVTTGLRVLGRTAYVMLTGISESRVAAVELDGGPRTIAACFPGQQLHLDLHPTGIYVVVEGQLRVFPLPS